VRGPSWADADLRQFIGPPFRQVFRALLQTDEPEVNERAIHAYRERFGTHGLYENVVYPDIPDALTRLGEAGVRLWVVTSNMVGDRRHDIEGGYTASPVSEYFGDTGLERNSSWPAPQPSWNPCLLFRQRSSPRKPSGEGQAGALRFGCRERRAARPFFCVC